MITGLRRFFLVLAVAALAFLSAAPAFALRVEGTRTLHYVAAYQPQFATNSYPYSATMVMTIHNGSLSGTYQDTSVRPGGVYSNRGPVSLSGLTNGSSITLNIGSSFTVQGTMSRTGTIRGRANYRGQFWNFEAKVGVPHRSGT